MSPYEALAAIAERELQLVSAGEMERLPDLYARREALVATLPATPPAAAKAVLERTLKLNKQTTAVLAERMRGTGVELRRLNQGRTAMRGYAPPVEPLKLVDQAG